jgi:chemotaxis methyl-accepting protein methylase
MAKSKSNKKIQNDSPVEEKADTAVTATDTRNDKFMIAGLGASAGGIQAFQQFFLNVPAKSGIAYVVILHMSPDHESHLAKVLQTSTKMPVTQVNEKVRVEADSVYVVPPNQHLTMQDGHIIVSPNIQIEDRRAPVDIFFRTLAEEHDANAIAVILSGTGANGSMGLKRVKEKGGATFVQNPREAEFNEMPRNAIATGLVDEVLNVSDIPAKIIAYKNGRGKIRITEDAEKRPQDQQQALRDIFTELRLRTGHDFTNYKRPTLLRRIERRLNIHNLPDLPSYVTFIYENPDEIQALLKDLLISVTNFFRDGKAFEVIGNEVLPLLLKGKNSENQLRIWVAGCATGEEAYSLAILCAEKTGGILDSPKIQIFATDIDETAIAEAREGLYSINDLADISQERLRRFFIKEGDDYRIRREVRETIMFANHNFLKDPPFSHLDLISCRNVMIYLNHVAQERMAETFHFALNPGGFLFLGSSESVDGAIDLFASYNRENHIFQSRQATPRAYPIPESIPNFRIDKPHIALLPEQDSKVLERISFGDLHQQLLEQYAPPSIVVNEEYDIVHLSERAGRYLQVGGGEPSQNLLKLVRPELRLDLRSALYQAVQRQSAVEARGLKVNVDHTPETINIHVRPVLRQGDTARGFILVLFEESVEETNGQEVLLSKDEPVARHLEEELMRLKTQLRTSGEQHEFQQEELKASNEELQAMNEELRSAAEELETSKEELQSINEELRTVNQELKVKIEETTLTSNNLQNLINSTDIGTIFLDRSLRVSLFPPSARNIFT